MSKRTLLLAGMLVEALCVSLLFFPSGPGAVIAFMAVHTAAYAVLSLLIFRMFHGTADADRALLWIVVAFGVLFRLTLVPHPPIASDDIYRYLWDGKVMASGENPYAFAPADPRLAHLATTDLPSKVNHAEIGTAYPPLAEAYCCASYLLVGDSLPGFKLLLALIDIGSIFLVIRLLRAMHRRPLWVLLYAWSPLPLVYGALDGHIDIVGVPFLLLTILYAVNSKAVHSAVAVAGAALVKFHPVVLAPLLCRLRRNLWEGVMLAMLAVVLFVAAYIPFHHHVDSLLQWTSIYGKRWEFNSGLFAITYAVVGDNERAHMVMAVMLCVYMLWLTLRKAAFEERLFLAALGLIVFSPTVHPWYLLWIAALLPIRWSAASFTFLGLSAVSNVVVWRYQSGWGWVDDPWLIALQYVPFAGLLVWEIYRNKAGLGHFQQA